MQFPIFLKRSQCSVDGEAIERPQFLLTEFSSSLKVGQPAKTTYSHRRWAVLSGCAPKTYSVWARKRAASLVVSKC